MASTTNGRPHAQDAANPMPPAIEGDDDIADFDFEFDEDIDAEFGEPWDPSQQVVA